MRLQLEICSSSGSTWGYSLVNGSLGAWGEGNKTLTTRLVLVYILYTYSISCALEKSLQYLISDLLSLCFDSISFVFIYVGKHILRRLQFERDEPWLIRKESVNSIQFNSIQFIPIALDVAGVERSSG